MPADPLRLTVGDWVIYRKQKSSKSPGPRATDVFPATAGDTYSYIVEKYWIVEDIDEEGDVTLRTRRGKSHKVQASDPSLRVPRWWERLLYRQRFEAISLEETDAAE